MKIYEITPIGKPRMTQRDRWHKRPATAAYWAYKEHVRLLGIRLPESGYHVTFVIPMPMSGARKSARNTLARPINRSQTKTISKRHYSMPSLMTAVVSGVAGKKIWGELGRIIIKETGVNDA